MKIEDKYYLDGDTFVAIFNAQRDENGEEYHYEIEYHLDEKEWTAVQSYAEEVFEGELEKLPESMLQMAKDAKYDLDKRWVRETIVSELIKTHDVSVASKLSDNIIDDVMQDIEETADENFNNSDIIIALGRVLLKRTAVSE